ncbi:MAG TPA: lactate utilization protein [Verrucomicrobiae bacterium]|nr:lactate utilization protein [Verrucomicrobiae bacterium]
MNAARENILTRVRTALRSESRHPPPATDASVFPPVLNSEVRFKEEFVALTGEVVQNLGQFLKGFTRIATDGNPLVQELVGAGNAGIRDADLGVTGCDCLVAQTGSVIVSTHSAGDRALSVLPPTHLIIAHRSQIVPDLDAAIMWLRERYRGHWPSALSLITGPSRTADIEKILVMGAHGPKRIAVYFVD